MIEPFSKEPSKEWKPPKEFRSDSTASYLSMRPETWLVTILWTSTRVTSSRETTRSSMRNILKPLKEFENCGLINIVCMYFKFNICI